MYYQKYKIEMFDPCSRKLTSHLETTSTPMRKHALIRKSKLIVISPKAAPFSIFPILLMTPLTFQKPRLKIPFTSLPSYEIILPLLLSH